jgi:hypothetical protein
MKFGAPLITNGAATGAAVAWPGGTGSFKAAGTWNGATVSLEFLHADGVTWQAMGTGTTLTANGGGLFTIGPCSIRAAVSGATPSGIYARVDEV